MESMKTMDIEENNKNLNSIQTNKVKLIVKSSNQQYQDEIIECEKSWTIQKLKEHLSNVYPAKPNITEQKLIYAGKLLTDKLILHEILRIYDDVENTNHIFHLVYTPKMSQQNQRLSQSSRHQPQSTSQTQQPQPVQQSDGLRYRNNVNNSASLNQSNIPILQQTNFVPNICPTNGPFNFQTVYPNYAANPNNNILAQQIAMQSWMHQAYLQYMNQYINLVSNGARPENFLNQNQMSNGSLPTGNSYFNIPQMPSFLSQPIAQNLINNQGHQTSTESPQHLPNPVDAAVGQQNQASQVEQPVAVADAAPPRFPQIVQDEQQQENRDWLDNFYSFSRLLLLLTLVYFYSSPLRCLIVLAIGLGFYINHIGYFRLHQQQNRNVNDNNNNNNNIARPQPAPPVENVQENNNADTPNNDNDSTPIVPSSSSNNDSIIPEAQGPNALAFLRTFVITFFTSLLPEGPTAL